MSTNRSRIVGSTQLRNKVNRNAFDLSHRHMFTAQIADILPVTCQWLNPGEKAEYGYQGFTRTTPLQTAAFTRLRENVQFFFVPFQSLWKYFNSQINNMTKGKDGQDISTFATSAYDTNAITTKMPYINYFSLLSRCSGIVTQMLNTIFTKENMVYAKNAPLGFVETYKRAFSPLIATAQLSTNSMTAPVVFKTGANNYHYLDASLQYEYCREARLFQSLGYGNFTFWQTYDIISNVYAFMLDKHPNFDVDLNAQEFKDSKYGYFGDWNVRGMENSPNLSIFPLLAYQHIYYDFYLNKDWQIRKANAYNIDFILPNGNMSYESYKPYTDYTNIDKFNAENIFTLHRSNNYLDYLNGILPSPQFGSESSVSLPVSVDVAKRVVDPDTSVPNGNLELSNINGKQSIVSTTALTSVQTPVTLTSSAGTSFSISSLRNALALQKYKEIQNSNDTDFESQVLALFGVKPRKGCDVMYLNGADSTIQINPQINNNLTSDNQAEIKAIATSQLSCQGSFTADTYGVLIGLYTCRPQFDYAHVGIDRNLFKTDASDFPNPVLDSVGMQTQYLTEVYAPSSSAKRSDWIVDASTTFAAFDLSRTYGYLPRYSELKTSYDRVDGAFLDAYRTWVTNIDSQRLSQDFWTNISTKDVLVDMAEFLRSNPHYTDSIFVNQSTATANDDRLLIGSVNTFKVVRPFSVSGLPWAN